MRTGGAVKPSPHAHALWAPDKCTFISARMSPQLQSPRGPINCTARAPCALVWHLGRAPVTPLQVRFQPELGCGVGTEWNMCPEGSHPLSQVPVYISAQGSGGPLLHLSGITYQLSRRLLGKANHSREGCTLSHEPPLSLPPQLGLLTPWRAS